MLESKLPAARHQCEPVSADFVPGFIRSHGDGALETSLKALNSFDE